MSDLGVSEEASPVCMCSMSVIVCLDRWYGHCLWLTSLLIRARVVKALSLRLKGHESIPLQVVKQLISNFHHQRPLGRLNY